MMLALGRRNGRHLSHLRPTLARLYSSAAKSLATGQTLTLPDKRTLGFHVSGPKNGTPVFYIHGTPDSGIQVLSPMETQVAQNCNIRWIGPDRPGIGLSTVQPNRKALDYPKDIRYLADHLGLEKYYTLGVSGGTGYALACAKMLSAERLRGVSICAGIGSWEFGLKGMSLRNKFGLYMWKWRPDWLTKHIEKTYVPLAQDPDPEKMAKQLRAEFSSFLKRIDAEIMMKDENLQSAVRSFRQVYGAGSEGHKVDILLNTRSWGFDLGDVAYRGIRLWYGSDDENTPPEMGRHMASRLYGSTYREDQGESYYSIWRKDALEEFILGMLRPRKES